MDFSLGVCILGDSSVGKSSFSLFLTTSKFNHKSIPTIGLEFAVKYFNIKKDNNDYKFKWNIWDTAGQEYYRSLVSSYYKNGTIIFIMFDLSDEKTFDSVDYWLKQLSDNGNGTKFIYLIGNKSDRPQKINNSKINDYINLNNLKYYEISVKNNINIDKMINEINNDIIDYINDNNIMKFEKKNIGIKFDNQKNLKIVKERDDCYTYSYSCCNII